MTSERMVALEVLLRVDQGGAWADRALQAGASRAHLTQRDRALAAHLAYGAIQRRRTLDHVVLVTAGRHPATFEPAVRSVVRLGAFQLLYSDRIPPHAAVSTAVELARVAGVGRASTLVNAVLRKVAADGPAVLAGLADATVEDAAIRRSYPDWIAQAWWDAFGPDAARAMMDAGNEPQEVTLRINTLRDGARERIVTELDSAGVAHHADPGVATAILLDDAFDIGRSQLFVSGDAVPMSRASQRIAPLLAPEPGMRVLDACSAPGGKAGHLAALLGGGDGLVCVERDRRRAGALQTALRRQGAASATIVCADVLELDPELGAFDAILLDAPCSGLGVIGGRPDLRWNRRRDEVALLARVQRRMIESLLARLVPGGRLVYAVCTLTPEENEGVTEGLAVVEELRTRPDRGDGDGFYAARIEPAAR